MTLGLTTPPGIPKGTATTAGDQIYATGPGAYTRLPVGTAFQVQRTNAAATAPEFVSGGTQLIGEAVLAGTAASIDFAAIPAGFRHLMVQWTARTDRASTDDDMTITFNGDTTATNYVNDYLLAAGIGVSAASALDLRRVALLLAASAPASSFATGVIDIPFYAAGSAIHRMALGRQFSRGHATTLTEIRLLAYGVQWEATTAINQVTFAPVVGPNFIAGTRIALYGIG